MTEEQKHPVEKKIHKISFGVFEIPTWYWSPFPKEYEVTHLWFCEFCLSYFTSFELLKFHMNNCSVFHPPGNEVYRDTVRGRLLSVFEVDGAKEETYCQNLGLLARLFLEHKFLQFDTKPFLYYIFCEVSSEGLKMVSYFSREKNSMYNFNLACILTLPCFQRRGYGNLMIQMSYEMSKRENKIGTPETPLSVLGKKIYHKNWKAMIYEALFVSGTITDLQKSVQITELSKELFMTPADIIETIKEAGWLKTRKDNYFIQILDNEKHGLKSFYKNGYKFNPKKLHWVPYTLEQKKEKVK